MRPAKMRIVGGRHRGRRLHGPTAGLRPTAERVREAVFNILIHGFAATELAGASVLDAFAGTGALGLEALSRGAAHATFLDTREVLAGVRLSAEAIGEAANVTLLAMDATRPSPPPLVAQAPCAIVFLDPPYHTGLAEPALTALDAKGWIAKGAACVAEVGAKEPFAAPEGFEMIDERTYGSSRVVFLRAGGEEPSRQTAGL